MKITYELHVAHVKTSVPQYIIILEDKQSSLAYGNMVMGPRVMEPGSR